MRLYSTGLTTTMTAATQTSKSGNARCGPSASGQFYYWRHAASQSVPMLYLTQEGGRVITIIYPSTDGEWKRTNLLTFFIFYFLFFIFYFLFFIFYFLFFIFYFLFFIFYFLFFIFYFLFFIFYFLFFIFYFFEK